MTVLPIWNRNLRAIVIMQHRRDTLIRYVINHEGVTLAAKVLVGEARFRPQANDNEVQP